MKLPAAVHVASAMTLRATVFLTGDGRIKAPATLRIEKWGSL
jgi:hypothetical protein